MIEINYDPIAAFNIHTQVIADRDSYIDAFGLINVICVFTVYSQGW